MATYTYNHPELLEKDQQEIFFQSHEMIEAMYPELFNIKTSTKGYEDGMRVAGLGTLHVKPEGTPVGFDDPVSAAKVRNVHTVFALGYRVTMEMMQDDQHEIIDQIPADLGDATRDHRERLAWSLVNDAFAGATFTGLIDGASAVSLCNATHTNLKTATTQSNVLTPAVSLSVTGLESLMNTASVTQSEEDRFINIEADKLVFHPNLQHQAHVLLKTEFEANSSVNNRSTVVSSQSGITPCRAKGIPYLTSETAWFLSGKNDLRWYDRMPVSFDMAKDSDTFDQKFYVHYRALACFFDWRGFWGSNS